MAVTVTLAIALFAGPLWSMSERAASGLIDPGLYIQQVLQ